MPATRVPDSQLATLSGERRDPSSPVRAAAGRWLMLSEHGPVARRHMTIAWVCILACAYADVILFASSRLSFASSNWADLRWSLLYMAPIAVFLDLVSHRLRHETGRVAGLIMRVVGSVALLLQFLLPFGLLSSAGVTLSYLLTATAMPLSDALLAQLDRALGFHWPSVLEAANTSPLPGRWLVETYNTIGTVVQLAVLWLALTCRGERLAEFVACLGLCTVGLGIGLWLVPAAGAFAYYEPAPHLYANLLGSNGMWSFSEAFNALRDGSLSVVDLSVAQGIVSFPSFHTILGVLSAAAFRDTRWLFFPVLVVNGAMILSTMPIGGHHLMDVLAGLGLSLGALAAVNRPSRKHQPALEPAGV